MTAAADVRPCTGCGGPEHGYEPGETVIDALEWAVADAAEAFSHAQAAGDTDEAQRLDQRITRLLDRRSELIDL